MLELWKINAYVSASGRRDVERWYDQLSDEAQAGFDAVIDYLVVRPRPEWIRPEFDLLSGHHAGIGEFRFQANKLQYRPLGFFGSMGSDYTLLIGATKKGKNYNPRDAKDTAARRMKEIRDGRSSIHAWVR